MADIKKTNENEQNHPQDSTHVATPSLPQGLTESQIQERIEAGQVNYATENLTRSVRKIVTGNIFNLFNILNIVLAIIIILVGKWQNTIFLGVAICNTAINIFQEIRSKRIIDKMSIVARSKIEVIRNGAIVQIDQEELVLDDILVLSAGNQICADGEVVYADGLEVDESLLSGESEPIKKSRGAKVLSGSFVSAGSGYIHVMAVGDDGYAAKLASAAKKEKKPKAMLVNAINKIIRILTFIIIPVGAILFYAQYHKNVDLSTSVLGTSSAMLGMIPEGLVFLTGVTLGIGAINLAFRKTLVQSLPSIETLARVDVICLDKTGTITNGTLKLEELLPIADSSEEQIKNTISELMHTLKDQNPTAEALRAAFSSTTQWECTRTIPFSSRRKWSGASFKEKGAFLLGAPELIFTQMDSTLANKISSYTNQGLRVLCLAHSTNDFKEDTVPAGTVCIALIILSDNIREDAADTFQYFAKEGVELKVISGDNAATVSNIAAKAGLLHAENYVDMSRIGKNDDLHDIVQKNTVFGRVSPQQKKALVNALQDQGHTVCMTGDGVNDVLALKEADCGVAMKSGGDAARSVADFVLLDSNFSAMIEVLKEGRRVINNIEQVAVLYLVKTIYSTLLSILFTFLPFAYPFTPLQLTPVNLLVVGIPSFFMALRPNYAKPNSQFISNILLNALPAALIVVIDILVVQLAGVAFKLNLIETSTMAVLLIGITGIILLFEISKPLNRRKSLLLSAVVIVFFAFFIIIGHYFSLGTLFSRDVFFYLPLAFSNRYLFIYIKQLIKKILSLINLLAPKFHQKTTPPEI